MGEDSATKRENYKRYKEEQIRILIREVKKRLYKELDWEAEDIIDNKLEIEQIVKTTIKLMKGMII